MDRFQLERGLEALEKVFGEANSPRTTGGSDMWYRVLGHLDVHVWDDAIITVCGQAKFWPRPREILKAAGSSNAAAALSWAQSAAGAAKTDPDRPRRIGENLARAEYDHDDDRRAYYESLMDNMSDCDREKALLGRAEMFGALAPGEGLGR